MEGCGSRKISGGRGGISEAKESQLTSQQSKPHSYSLGEVVKSRSVVEKRCHTTSGQMGQFSHC